MTMQSRTWFAALLVGTCSFLAAAEAARAADLLDQWFGTRYTALGDHAACCSKGAVASKHVVPAYGRGAAGLLGSHLRGAARGCHTHGCCGGQLAKPCGTACGSGCLARRTDWSGSLNCRAQRWNNHWSAWLDKTAHSLGWGRCGGCHGCASECGCGGKHGAAGHATEAYPVDDPPAPTVEESPGG